MDNGLPQSSLAGTPQKGSIEKEMYLEPSLELLKFRPALPGDALEVGAVFVGELAGDGTAIAVLGFVVSGGFHGRTTSHYLSLRARQIFGSWHFE